MLFVFDITQAEVKSAFHRQNRSKTRAINGTGSSMFPASVARQAFLGNPADFGSGNSSSEPRANSMEKDAIRESMIKHAVSDFKLFSKSAQADFEKKQFAKAQSGYRRALNAYESATLTDKTENRALAFEAYYHAALANEHEKNNADYEKNLSAAAKLGEELFSSDPKKYHSPLLDIFSRLRAFYSSRNSEKSAQFGEKERQYAAFSKNTSTDFRPYSFYMPIDNCFAIAGRGTQVNGKISQGNVRTGDTVCIEHGDGSITTARVSGTVLFSHMLDYVEEGDNCGILLDVQRAQMQDARAIFKKD